MLNRYVGEKIPHMLVLKLVTVSSFKTCIQSFVKSLQTKIIINFKITLIFTVKLEK